METAEKIQKLQVDLKEAESVAELTGDKKDKLKAARIKGQLTSAMKKAEEEDDRTRAEIEAEREKFEAEEAAREEAEAEALFSHLMDEEGSDQIPRVMIVRPDYFPKTETPKKEEAPKAQAKEEAKPDKQEAPAPKEQSDPHKLSLTEVLAKAARMEETAKALRKVEELANLLNSFEVGREGQEAVLEFKDRNGTAFKTANSYLCEAVLRTLKTEMTQKGRQLEQELRALY